MTTYGCVMVSRNDGYGENQLERTAYSVNSALRNFDEVIITDWASEGIPLLRELKPFLLEEHRNKIRSIIVTPEQAKEFTKQFEDAQRCVEVLGRNIGLRRLSTDYLLSTNPDIILPSREHLEGFNSIDTFSTVGKRTISLYEIRNMGGVLDDITLNLKELEASYGQQPVVGVCPGDEWSLVSGCGDFQIAHKSIWYNIKGFEESLVYRGYADSNIQKKALLFGYKIEVNWNIPVWHIGHADGGGGFGAWNNVETALQFFTQTTNPDTWGFSDLEFYEETL